MNEIDPLSEVLRGVRLRGAIFLEAELGTPWGFESEPTRAAPLLAPEAEQVIFFHLLTEGEATVRAEGAEPLVLRAGDIVVLPRGDAHRIWNGAVRELIDASALLPKILSGAIVSERGGGTGPRTKFICGYVACEAPVERQLLAGLPAAFKTNIRRDSSGQWLESSLRHLAAEAGSLLPGRAALLAKLAEALFIETLRRYMAELPDTQPGFLAAARDEAIGRALGAIHRDPAHRWTVAELAKRAGCSRTVFAERFAQLLEAGPLAYVARCRLQRGARLLVTTDDTVLSIAAAVGYESEAAFNRAFRRELGEPPARYRKQRRKTSAAVTKKAQRRRAS